MIPCPDAWGLPTEARDVWTLPIDEFEFLLMEARPNLEWTVVRCLHNFKLDDDIRLAGCSDGAWDGLNFEIEPYLISELLTFSLCKLVPPPWLTSPSLEEKDLVDYLFCLSSTNPLTLTTCLKFRFELVIECLLLTNVSLFLFSCWEFIVLSKGPTLESTIC